MIAERLNRLLDRLATPAVRVGGRTLVAFQLCGCAGLEMAVLLALGLVVSRGHSPWVMGAIIGAAILTFYALTYAGKIVSGEEQLVYYHHEIAVLCSAALTAWALGGPVLAYLDATTLGVGAFLACGRVGCLMAGCCHGRPHRWGVRYRHEHAAIGLPRYYVGLRLFPIQAVESLWVAATVAVGTALALRGAPYGAAMAWYIVVYDIGRYLFEFVRGDSGRRYLAGFSEAQWIALALTWLVALGGLAGLLPRQGWHLVAALGMSLATLGIALWRRLRGDRRHLLLRPGHVAEVARALEQIVDCSLPRRPDSAPPAVAVTSLGYRISVGELELEGRRLRHYTLSCSDGELGDRPALALAELVGALQPPRGGLELLRGERGAIHLLVSAGD
jgi:hypothetical protein